MEQMQSELNSERAEFQKMESAKLTLEKQVRNLRIKLKVRIKEDTVLLSLGVYFSFAAWSIFASVQNVPAFLARCHSRKVRTVDNLWRQNPVCLIFFSI